MGCRDRRFLPLVALLALAACVAAPPAEVSMARPGDGLSALSPPRSDSVSGQAALPPVRSNTEIAADFLELSFRMESGRALPGFSRFEGPVTIALTGAVPATAPADLARLQQRLRAEAGIDLRSTTGAASITVDFVPRRQIQRLHSNVACFVVPRVSSWPDYRKARGSARLDWATVGARDRAAIFIPSDSSPQEVRDCLHEEVAQALGPLNDLYELPDSVFNDDNFHTVLTGFDMLILRLTYAGDLRSGMPQAEVAARLPGLLARLNPAGQHPGAPVPERTPEVWIEAMEAALGRRASASAQRQAAQRALAIAQARGWRDSRLAFSYFAVGRASLGADAGAALAALVAAARLYNTLPGAGIHAAHVEMQLAAFALSQGDAQGAVVLADRAIPVVKAGENAALLATLMLVKAEALDLLGRTAEADALRLDSQAWARYGFGAESVVRERMQDIAALVPRESRG